MLKGRFTVAGLVEVTIIARTASTPGRVQSMLPLRPAALQIAGLMF